MLPRSTKGKTTANNGTKKRAATKGAATAEHEGGEAPAKKAKVRTFRRIFFLFGIPAIVTRHIAGAKRSFYS